MRAGRPDSSRDARRPRSQLAEVEPSTSSSLENVICEVLTPSPVLVSNPGVNGADIERWRGRFVVAAARDRDLLAKAGPRPAWSIAVALSMYEEAEQLETRPDPTRREAEAEPVRRVWARLRARYR